MIEAHTALPTATSPVGTSLGRFARVWAALSLSEALGPGRAGPTWGTYEGTMLPNL